MRAAIGKLKHISPAAGNRLSQSRAVRRMGELYKTFNAQGQRTDQLKEGTLQKLTQKEVAESAGLSEHQAKQAVRVANVPADKFEAAIEQSKPATVRRRGDPEIISVYGDCYGNYFRMI